MDTTSLDLFTWCRYFNRPHSQITPKLINNKMLKVFLILIKRTYKCVVMKKLAIFIHRYQ